jgi:hypothetical protein
MLCFQWVWAIPFQNAQFVHSVKEFAQFAHRIMSTIEQPAIINGSQIMIMPAQAEYAEQMEALLRHVYEVRDDEVVDDLNAAAYRHHIEVFPEGQLIALEVETDRVVGMSSNMRLNFDPAQPVLKPWLETVDYG